MKTLRQSAENISAGDFGSMEDFLSYYDIHYKPMLEKIKSDNPLMGFFVHDIIYIFK